jgi:NAD(P)-dependent dehydrogenase (short-subunit alcohol dehydrogenase family)
MNDFDFTGKRVLVTGASHGIGYAVAEAFARSGGDVAILSSSNDILDAGKAIAAATGRAVKAEVCDITDRTAVRRVVGGLGRLDILVNNAGLELITPILEPGEEVERRFERIIQINVVGTYYVTREAVPAMQAGGCIILTASIWGKTAAAEFSAYCASKHANIGFMRVLAKELGPRGITVNAVCPGWVKTRAALRSLSEMARRAGRPEQDMLAEVMAAQSLGG